MRRHICRLLAAWCLAVAVVASAAGTAFADAEADRAEPPIGGVVDTAPAEVRVWFTQELFRREGANTLAVFGPDGSQVDNRDTCVDDDDRTLMIVSLAAGLPAGDYTVRWHSLSSEDGDEDEGEFTFTVRGAAATDTTETPAAEPTATAAATTSPTATVGPAVAPTDTPAPAPTAGQTGIAIPCLSGALVLAPLGLVAIVRRGRHV